MSKIKNLWNSCGFIFKAFLVIMGFCCLMAALANPIIFIAVPVALVVIIPVFYFVTMGCTKFMDSVNNELEKEENRKQRQKENYIKDQKYLDGLDIFEIGNDIYQYEQKNFYAILRENYGFDDIKKMEEIIFIEAQNNSIYSKYIVNFQKWHELCPDEPWVVSICVVPLYILGVHEFMWQRGYDPFSKKDRIYVRDNFKEDLYYLKKATLEIYLKALYKDNKSVFVDQSFQYYIIEDQSGETRWFYFD